MYNLLLILHVVVCTCLVIVILIQRGRGGGLVEALAGAESLFGTKTSSFLVKLTTVLAVIFFVTSTSLAFLSKQRSRSLLDRSAISEESVKQESEEQAKEVQPSSKPDSKPADVSEQTE